MTSPIPIGAPLPNFGVGTLPRHPLVLEDLDTSTAGFWYLVGHSRRTGKAYDLTAFRGIPSNISSYSFSDPFGPKQLTLNFPQVTIFDAVGEADLDWVWKGAGIELIWVGPLPPQYPFGQPLWQQVTRSFNDAGNQTKHATYQVLTGWKPVFSWEGSVSTFDVSRSSGMTLTCSGAMYQVDRYLSKPEYVPRPFPYEVGIAEQFLRHPHLRTKHLQVGWPSNWSKFYATPPPNTPAYLIPHGVTDGHPWTGLLTRSTGSWEASLTSYVQGLLSAMYTEHGRWTLDLAYGRVPLLVHRAIKTTPDNSTTFVDLVAPGNDAVLTVDWSQSLDIVYAQGTGLDGVQFSGMEVSNDGSTTYYEPAAYRHQAYPEDHTNKWLDPLDMPQEVLLQVQQGLDPAGGADVARSHLNAFADPGATGEITLAVDPTMNGVSYPRALVRAGMDIAVPGFLGRPEPTVFHITDTSMDLVAGQNSLTVDTKFRDSLTVAEVRDRGRDAMRIPRMIVGGQYQPPVPDQLVPWDYAKGSGYIPSAHDLSCVELFQGIPEQMPFPWTPWTKKRPPSDPRWRHSYIHIGPASNDADDNWAYGHGGGPHAGKFAIGVRAAQSAQIRLLQVAAYDKNGNVFPVPFHISFYWSAGASVDATPIVVPSQLTGVPTKYRTPGGQHYPFAQSAWEQYKSDGTLSNNTLTQAVSSAGLIRAYGTYYQQAGFYPGSGTTTGAPVAATTPPSQVTGLLVDESIWSVDTTLGPTGNNSAYSTFNPNAPKKGQPAGAGFIHVLIYCDAQGNEDVYFLGRMFRVEPGTGS